MKAKRSMSRRERALIALMAVAGLSVVATQLVDFHTNREAKILTLRSDIAARSVARDTVQSLPVRRPIPWFGESDPSRAALQLHGNLEERATQLGLLVESIHASADPGDSVEAQARIQGSYAETVALLAALEQSAPPLLITDLTLVRLAKSPGGEARLDSTLAVRAYLSSN